MPAAGARQNWESLRVFAACAEHLSFTAAAEELGLTQAAVSQRIGELERRLGARLFARRPRLRLTAEGVRLAPRIALGFAAIERAIGELRAPRTLSVTTILSFATLWLLPRMAELRRHDPDLSLALDISDENRSLDDGRYDLAIRGIHRVPPAGLRAQLLFPIELTPFVSRQLVQPGDPLTIEALARLPLIPEPAWHDWFRAAGVRPPARSQRGRLLVQSQHLILEGVLAGEGAGLLTPRLVESHVASGRLWRPFPQTITEGAYYLLWHKDREDDPLIGSFRRWVTEQLRA
jgi:LysR family glycine cleavage system transcriptional activator